MVRRHDNVWIAFSTSDPPVRARRSEQRLKQIVAYVFAVVLFVHLFLDIWLVGYHGWPTSLLLGAITGMAMAFYAMGKERAPSRPTGPGRDLTMKYPATACQHSGKVEVLGLDKKTLLAHWCPDCETTIYPKET